jgi:hypothetical protein
MWLELHKKCGAEENLVVIKERVCVVPLVVCLIEYKPFGSECPSLYLSHFTPSAVWIGGSLDPIAGMDRLEERQFYSRC